MREALARARRFLETDLWDPERYQELPRMERAAFLTLRSLYLLGFAFGRERLRLRAAALTYISMLSIVPALAVVFSVFAAFGGLRDAKDSLRKTVVEWIAVTEQETVTEYLDKFVGSVHAGAIGGFGVLFLVLTALSLLQNMERALNDIWGVKEERSFLERFQSYWPLLTLGPVLFGVSLTATAAVQQNAATRGLISALPGLGALLSLAPVLFTWTGFTLMYVIVPNTRVPFRFAVVGGIAGGTLWELAKVLYAYYARQAISYSAIYGSLSAIPLFVIWLFVSWMVVLVGASLTFAAQNARTFQPKQEIKPLAQHEKERLSAWLLLKVYEHYEAGHGAISGEQLVSGVSGPPSALRRILGELVTRGLLVTTSSRADTSGACYLPQRPADKTTLSDLIRELRAGEMARAADGRAPNPLEQRVQEILERAEDAQLGALGSVSIAELLEGATPATPVAGPAQPASPSPSAPSSSEAPGVGRPLLTRS